MRWILLALLALLSGCTFFREATRPMPAMLHRAPAGSAHGLIVMLPGMGDEPDDYVTNEFVAMVHRENPGFDVLCPDAHFGYYQESSIVERLHEDLLAGMAPHYQHVWLLGISLGGLGCVAYAAEHPGVAEGVILLAPYMGSKEILDEVRSAGGPRTWTPPDTTEEDPASLRRYNQIWTWYHDVVTKPDEMPKLFLGWGEQDGFAMANQMVADELPAERWVTCDGGHKWSSWKPLFDQLAPRALRNLR